MNTKLLFALTLLLGSLLALPATAAETKRDAKAELKELISKIQVKLQAGQRTESDLAENLKSFDALLTEHRGEKSDEVADILFMKAALYIEVLDNPEKGLELLKQLQRDFPLTARGKSIEVVIASVQKGLAAQKIRASLVVGSKFPDFVEKDPTGKPLASSNFRGKVVLIDFWATWCGPCVAELPNVLQTYAKHHAQGFEIIGISLDENEKQMSDFTKTKKVTWAQYFDGKRWENKLAQKYGVVSIPSTYLLNGAGQIIAKDLRGEELELAVAKALGK